jgi:ABC-2 type transport system permease protein
MRPILVITLKDLTQLIRNRMTFLFLLIMPIAFTLLFGYAFGGFSRETPDPRLPVGFLDLDHSDVSRQLGGFLADSAVIRLDEHQERSVSELESLVSKKDLVSAIVIPAGYGEALLLGNPLQLTLINDPVNTASMTIESEVSRIAARLANGVLTARIIADSTSAETFIPAMNEALKAWQTPPITLQVTHSQLIKKQDTAKMSLAHTAPGMMLQFAIASLLTSALILVNERKSRALQRLLTTQTARWQILFGHYLAILAMLLTQFVLLIAFGQLALGLDYMRIPFATLLVTLSTTACLAALGLLIGTLAKTDEQAIIFSLVPMFVFAGLGGAWVPLEYTGEVFRTIGHLTPVAWGMDGFQNIISRGLGFGSILIPVLALFGYAILFFGIAAWKFSRSQE